LLSFRVGPSARPQNEADFLLHSWGFQPILRKENKERNYHLQEVRYGSFERSIPLPAEVATQKAQAELEDGLLRVTLPKQERDR